MKARSIYSLFLVTFLALALPSCRKVAVGYLDATHATFAAKELKVYRTVPDDDPHSLKREYPAPWTSQRIQGVSGTTSSSASMSPMEATLLSSLPLSRTAKSPSTVVRSTSSLRPSRPCPTADTPSIYGSTTRATAVSSVASSPSSSKTKNKTRSL